MIEIFTLVAVLVTLLVSVISLVLIRRSSPEISCQHSWWCWRRVTSVQEHDVPAEAVGTWASEVSMTVPLCRKHETKFDKSEITKQISDRFGGRDNPA